MMHNASCESRKRPIGIFDSGLGGLTVLGEIRKLLPHEDIIYFGDNGRTPYGTKSRETVVRYTLQDVGFLKSKGVKAVVIACNTASACSLDTVRATFDIPVIEVIEPGSAAAVRATSHGRIGVIGTQATIESGVYERAIRAAASRIYRGGKSGGSEPEIKYFGKACPLFVSLAEEGWWDGEITRLTAEKYLAPLKEAHVDTLVLGCTHYPLLTPVIAGVMGPEVRLINSAAVVADAVKERLLAAGLLRDTGYGDEDGKKANVAFYTSDSIEKFKTLGSRFLGAGVSPVEKIDIEKY